MPSQTAAPWAIPYPIGTDRVMDGDNAIQGVADRMHALFNQNIKGVPVPQTQTSTFNGWTGQVSYFVRSGVCMVFFSVGKAAWAANEAIASIPDPYRPYLPLYLQASGLNTLLPVAVAAGTDGGLRVISAYSGGAHGGVIGHYTYLYGNTTP